MSNSWPPRELQHTRLPCPSLSPRICWDSCPLSSATLVSFCLQSFPASMSFPVSWLFVSGGQNIEASASASVFPMNVQGWFPLGLTGLISLQDSQESSLAPQFRGINSSVLCLLHGPTLTSVNDYWKTMALTIRTFVGKVMSLLFNMLSRFVIAFLPRSKCLLNSQLQSSSTVILEPSPK